LDWNGLVLVCWPPLLSSFPPPPPPLPPTPIMPIHSLLLISNHFCPFPAALFFFSSTKPSNVFAFYLLFLSSPICFPPNQCPIFPPFS
jgi:hypothetical protein